LLDCDVEEPNAHIFIKPVISDRQRVTIPIPKLIEDKCSFCGKCQQACIYNAIAVLEEKVMIFDNLCHSCGACSYICPSQALTEAGKEIGFIEFGKRDELQFIDARLNLGEMMAPPLIRALKKNIKKDKDVVIDAPPGTSCPVITSISGSDFVVLVTEPTSFGLNDLDLAVRLLKKLGLPFGVVINRYGLGNDCIENYCRKQNIEILLKINFRRDFARCYSRGNLIVEVFPEYKAKFLKMFQTIKKRTHTISNG
jgi:MinD superfamily P-loop ATPase